MAFLRFCWDVTKGTLLYLAIVAGGLTLFLVLAPIFGYLPYSDRPGPGWYGHFPALGWSEFWSNALEMLSYGTFIALLIAIGGGVCVLLIRLAERFGAPLLAVRLAGGLLTAIVTGWFVLGAGWYIALGLPAWITATTLGLIAGAWILPRRARALVV